MKRNNELRLHIVNVGHGDSILVEFPDCTANGLAKVRFGLVDAGGEAPATKKTLNYLKAFLDYRLEGDDNGYIFEFICLTHPHHDHYVGMLDVLEFFSGTGNEDDLPRQFWDCGFRYNTLGYLNILNFLYSHPRIQFMRITAGTEFHYDDVEVVALAPSMDLRNRYDTYGVELNNASIVLRITRSKGVAVLAGDAHFDSWGKICEEFPRKKHMIYPPDAKTKDPGHQRLVFTSLEDQLNCQFLKVAHHGSKNGTTYEYLDKLRPNRFAITCKEDRLYKNSWQGKFPHPITRRIISEVTKHTMLGPDVIPTLADLNQGHKVCDSATHGSLVYTITKGGRVNAPACLNDKVNEGFNALKTKLDAEL